MNTVELAFETYGDQEKPPLLILHGFFASSRNWWQIARLLADRFHVYVLDLRNHGQSPHIEEMDYPVMAADVARFIDRFALSPVMIMGHSMGGKVAMWLALNHPKKVGKLLVVDIAPVHYQHTFDSIIKALRDLPLEKISNRKDATALLSSAIPEQSFCQFLLQNLQLIHGEYRWRIDLDYFARNAANIPSFPCLDHIIPFTGETLFIAGGDSQHIKPEYSNTIKAMFPASELITIPDTGHWLHVETPSLFVKSVTEFLI